MGMKNWWHTTRGKLLFNLENGGLFYGLYANVLGQCISALVLIVGGHLCWKRRAITARRSNHTPRPPPSLVHIVFGIGLWLLLVARPSEEITEFWFPLCIFHNRYEFLSSIHYAFCSK
jgi:hypothetical protein